MFSNKKNILLSSMLFIGSSHIYAGNFNDSVILGDSLSDGGNVGLATMGQPTKFTTNPGKTTAEIVSENVGYEITASLLGGQNYAWGGATVTELEKKVPNLQQQLAQYLATNNGKANEKTLYQVWGGGNDIFNLVTQYQTGAINLQQLQINLLTAANEEVSILKSLKDAGAKYVIVYNLPDMGLTPDAHAGGAMAVGLMTQLSDAYNTQLSNGMSELTDSGFNIIPINVYGLLGEITQNPSQYGIQHLVDTACSGSSLGCNANGQGYMFADGVHPTSQTHELLAQVVLSTLSAPQQVALLSELPLLSRDAQKRSIYQEIMNAKNSEKIRTFATVDYTKQKIDATASNPSVNSKNINLNLGAAYQINNDLTGGVALSLNEQDGALGQNSGDYELQTLNSVLFTSYQKNNNYMHTYLNAGRLYFNDITRNIHIGPTVRAHKADTKGSQYGLGIELGHSIKLDKKVNIQPFAGMDWQKVKVHGYAENDITSTAMWFGDQKRESLTTNIGLRFKGQLEFNHHFIEPIVEASWNHEFKDNALRVNAGSKSMNGGFEMQGYEPEKDWWSVNLGIHTQFRNNLSSWFMVNSTLLNETKNNYGLNIGLKYIF